MPKERGNTSSRPSTTAFTKIHWKPSRKREKAAHIPELPEIAESLGLGEYIELCITSARVGYEKPNPAIFRIALEAAGHPHEAWMVGDRIEADIRGAENCGIKAILVRREPEKPVKYSSRDLLGVLEIIKKDGDGRGAE